MTRAQATSFRSAPHYTWGEACDGWHLVRTEQLSVIHERMPPGTAEVRHYHQIARQFFFVLRGSLVIDVDGERVVLEAHQGLEIDPGCSHQVMNCDANAVEFLVVSQPPTIGDRYARESGG